MLWRRKKAKSEKNDGKNSRKYANKANQIRPKLQHLNMIIINELRQIPALRSVTRSPLRYSLPLDAMFDNPGMLLNLFQRDSLLWVKHKELE